ncbi:FIMAH domain-containing protein [Lentibacillus salicampi]
MGPDPSEWGSDLTDLSESMTPAATDGLSISASLYDFTDSEGDAVDSDKGKADKLFDNTSETELNFENGKPWIQYQFNEKKKAKMYTLTSGSDSDTSDPKSWVLKGSNDGENWSVLDEREDETFRWRDYTRAFEINNPRAYAFYQMEITDNGGGQSTTLAEVELLGMEEPPAEVAAGIRGLVQRLHEEGELESEAVHALKMHLTAVEQFEKQGKAKKVVKHMKSFNLLLKQHHESGLLSDEAYHMLQNNADYMIKLWR